MPAASSYTPRFEPNPLIICGVDSLMNAPLPSNGAAAQIAALFPTAQVINNCINGWTLTQAIADYPTLGATQWNAAYARNLSFFAGGSNDITGGADAATVLARIASFWALNLATGYIPLVCTIIADGLMSAPQDAIRLVVNTGIRATYPVGQVVDWAANTHYDTAAKTADAVYYYDTVHPTSPVGVGILAGIAQTPITALLA